VDEHIDSREDEKRETTVKDHRTRHLTVEERDEIIRRYNAEWSSETGVSSEPRDTGDE